MGSVMRMLTRSICRYHLPKSHTICQRLAPQARRIDTSRWRRRVSSEADEKVVSTMLSRVTKVSVSTIICISSIQSALRNMRSK